VSPAVVAAMETRHLRGAARRTGEGSHVAQRSQPCEFCHKRPSAGFAITGDRYKHACKRCADAIFGLDDRG
jgi:hypothetical protein